MNFRRVTDLAFVKYKKNQALITAVGKRVRELREQNNLSQQELANKANMELSQLNRIELGKINTSISHLGAISEALGVPLPEIVDVKYD